MKNKAYPLIILLLIISGCTSISIYKSDYSNLKSQVIQDNKLDSQNTIIANCYFGATATDKFDQYQGVCAYDKSQNTFYFLSKTTSKNTISKVLPNWYSSYGVVKANNDFSDNVKIMRSYFVPEDELQIQLYGKNNTYLMQMLATEFEPIKRELSERKLDQKTAPKVIPNNYKPDIFIARS
jgi:hypothetical protein